MREGRNDVDNVRAKRARAAESEKGKQKWLFGFASAAAGRECN